jgi:hypothetical protein
VSRAEGAENAEKRGSEKKKREGDCMDYEITWIEAYMCFVTCLPAGRSL